MHRNNVQVQHEMYTTHWNTKERKQEGLGRKADMCKYKWMREKKRLSLRGIRWVTGELGQEGKPEKYES